MYRSIKELSTGLRSRMRDPSSTAQRWSDNEILDALNTGIAEFHNHVGFYVSMPMPQDDDGLYAPPYYAQDQSLVFVNGVVKVTQTVPGDPVIGGAIVNAWVYNQPIPNAEYTLAAALSSGDTEMVVEGLEFPPVVGHFQVGLEIIRYNGVEAGALNEFTLSNIQRNMNGGGDNDALIDSPVYPVVYMDDSRLYNVLMDKSSAYLHQLYTNDASPTQIQDHQWTMRWNTQQVANFWRSYVPSKQFVRRPMRKNY